MLGMEWVKASYSEGQVQDVSILGTVSYVGANGKYNVYKMDGYDKHLVIFDNQGKLLNYVEDNIHSVFLFRLMLSTNNKYKYVVEIGGEKLEVYTVARALAIIPGTEDDTRNVRLNGLAVIID